MIFFFRNYSDLSAIMSSRSAQVTHALSHHLYTNTYMDHETIAFYPIVSFFSLDKSVVHRYMVKNICQIIFLTIIVLEPWHPSTSISSWQSPPCLYTLPKF